jgi:hypothetical protein
MSWLAGHPAHSGASPGWVGAIVVGLAMAIVALAFALCVRYFLYPGEASPSHIKRRILE